MRPPGAALSATGWLTAGLAALVSGAVVALVRRTAPLLGLLDVPNERSSHQQVRPRGGGLGVLLGLLAGTAAGALLGATWDRRAGLLLVAVTGVALIGLWDDLRPLPVWPRLLVQLVAAAAVATAIGALPRLPLPPPLDLPLGALALPFTVLWLTAVTNFFNFMDGIDGLAAGQAALSLALVAVCGWDAAGRVVALAALGATLAFLAHNWPPARIFLGDVGSGTLGFLLGALPLLAPVERRGATVLAMAISLALFLLDPLFTLLARWRRGQRLGAAHRDHRYQRLARGLGSHGRTTIVLLAAGALLAGLAGFGLQHPRGLVVGSAVAVALVAIEWWLPGRLWPAASASGGTPAPSGQPADR